MTPKRITGNFFTVIQDNNSIGSPLNTSRKGVYYCRDK